MSTEARGYYTSIPDIKPNFAKYLEVQGQEVSNLCATPDNPHNDLICRFNRSQSPGEDPHALWINTAFGSTLNGEKVLGEINGRALQIDDIKLKSLTAGTETAFNVNKRPDGEIMVILNPDHPENPILLKDFLDILKGSVNHSQLAVEYANKQTQSGLDIFEQLSLATPDAVSPGSGSQTVAPEQSSYSSTAYLNVLYGFYILVGLGITALAAQYGSRLVKAIIENEKLPRKGEQIKKSVPEPKKPEPEPPLVATESKDKSEIIPLTPKQSQRFREIMQRYPLGRQRDEAMWRFLKRF